MKYVLFLLLSSCAIFSHPQYCHTDGDCLNGQYCPGVRTPEQPPLVCRDKAIHSPMMGN